MENVNKALLMAGATLIGVLILALVVVTMGRIGALSAERESQQSVEQVEKFNQEYEAYNKKLMFGVDVLSCLNKARSNNEKYIEDTSFLTGNLYSKEYIIDVAFNLKKPLQDRIKVYYLSVQKTTLPDGTESSKISAKETEYANGYGPAGEGNSYNPSGSDKNASYERVFKVVCDYKDYLSNIVGASYSSESGGGAFSKDNTIKECTITSKMGGSTGVGKKSDGFYHLLNDFNGITIVEGTGDAAGRYVANFGSGKKYYTNPKTDNFVKSFLNMSTYQRVNVKHVLNKQEDNTENAILKFKCWDGTSSDRGWSSAEWQTSIYDFKSRKFRCDGVTYSDITGRIINLIFTEI